MCLDESSHNPGGQWGASRAGDCARFPLAALAECGECGQLLLARSATRGRRFYSCPTTGCPMELVDAEPVEAAVAHAVLARCCEPLALLVRDPDRLRRRWRSAAHADLRSLIAGVIAQMIVVDNAPGAPCLFFRWAGPLDLPGAPAEDAWSVDYGGVQQYRAI